ncbi:uncharacterized protein [Notamacropus eugenii]|uniref:uncharacterized protein n=1 Tax=Notamacropus eugenii TaxID=9315 RepID=UPI003B66C2E3
MASSKQEDKLVRDLPVVQEGEPVLTFHGSRMQRGECVRVDVEDKQVKYLVRYQSGSGVSSAITGVFAHPCAPPRVPLPLMSPEPLPCGQKARPSSSSTSGDPGNNGGPDTSGSSGTSGDGASTSRGSFTSTSCLFQSTSSFYFSGTRSDFPIISFPRVSDDGEEYDDEGCNDEDCTPSLQDSMGTSFSPIPACLSIRSSFSSTRDNSSSPSRGFYGTGDFLNPGEGPSTRGPGLSGSFQSTSLFLSTRDSSSSLQITSSTFQSTSRGFPSTSSDFPRPTDPSTSSRNGHRPTGPSTSGSFQSTSLFLSTRGNSSTLQITSSTFQSTSRGFPSTSSDFPRPTDPSISSRDDQRPTDPSTNGSFQSTSLFLSTRGSSSSSLQIISSSFQTTSRSFPSTSGSDGPGPTVPNTSRGFPRRIGPSTSGGDGPRSTGPSTSEGDGPRSTGPSTSEGDGPRPTVPGASSSFQSTSIFPSTSGSSSFQITSRGFSSTSGIFPRPIGPGTSSKDGPRPTGPGTSGGDGPRPRGLSTSRGFPSTTISDSSSSISSFPSTSQISTTSPGDSGGSSSSCVPIFQGGEGVSTSGLGSQSAALGATSKESCPIVSGWVYEWIPENQVLCYSTVHLRQESDVKKEQKEDHQVTSSQSSDQSESDISRVGMMQPRSKRSRLTVVRGKGCLPRGVRRSAAGPGKETLGRQEVQIHLPKALSTLLMQDWELVTLVKKLFILPAKKTVSVILAEYATFQSSCQTPDKSEAVSALVTMIQEYFDMVLDTQLLYKSEKQQHAKLLAHYPSCQMCQLYGGAHLLRLFQHLGPMLTCSSLDESSINVLLSHLQDFLEYLASDTSQLFTAATDYHKAFPEYQQNAE